jgi:hypothetical protein
MSRLGNVSLNESGFVMEITTKLNLSVIRVSKRENKKISQNRDFTLKEQNEK